MGICSLKSPQTVVIADPPRMLSEEYSITEKLYETVISYATAETRSRIFQAATSKSRTSHNEGGAKTDTHTQKV